MSVDGVYLPPPLIEFGEVLVETFNEDSDGFIDIIDNNAKASNETYFDEVTTAASRLSSTEGTMEVTTIILFLLELQ